MQLTDKQLNRMVAAALREDRAYNDISAKAVGGISRKAKFKIIAKQSGIICGLKLAEKAFKLVDSKVSVKSKLKDGSALSSGTVVLGGKGSVDGILRAERTALNFLSHMSGIATLTSKFVQKLKGTKTRLLDTRKTLPGLRDLEKYAVRMGGGCNHRRDLSDMYLLKENHIVAAGGIREALSSAIEHRKRVTSRRKSAVPPIEIEVTNLKEFETALEFDIDRIMLDNFTPAMVSRAVELSKKTGKYGKVEIEVSGGINLKNVERFANSGVDFISVGAVTHSAPAFDLSLVIE